MAGDAEMFTVDQTIGSVLCCRCGISMAPNAANKCVRCLRSEVDITEGIQRHVSIIHCPKCDSYLQPPQTWVNAQRESKELLNFCIKRLKDLDKVRLVNAEFIWTKPYSKWLKVKLSVQKEVFNGVILEQSFVVAYVVQDRMCGSCSRVSCSRVQVNPDQWIAAVQLHQFVTHRRTFFYLEQLILKHNAAVKAIRIKQTRYGIDFFFGTRNHAVKFIEFIAKVAVINRREKQVTAYDSKGNSFDDKDILFVEICAICHDDLICLPQKVAVSLGNLGPLVICTKVSNIIDLMDPLTSRHCCLDADQYRKMPFMPLLSSRQLVEYIVLDVEPLSSEGNVAGSKCVLAEIARVLDFGKNNTRFFVKTHLGHILKAGDYALGYDLHAANYNDVELDKYKGLIVPDVILIKKSYEQKRQEKGQKVRSWKLKSLNMEVDDVTRAKSDEEKGIDEYEQFLRDLEENPKKRFNISLYRNKEYQPLETASMTDGEDVPSVPLEELFDDLDLNDEEDKEDSMSE